MMTEETPVQTPEALDHRLVQKHRAHAGKRLLPGGACVQDAHAGIGLPCAPSSCVSEATFLSQAL